MGLPVQHNDRYGGYLSCYLLILLYLFFFLCFRKAFRMGYPIGGGNTFASYHFYYLCPRALHMFTISRYCQIYHSESIEIFWMDYGVGRWAKILDGRKCVIFTCGVVD